MSSIHSQSMKLGEILLRHQYLSPQQLTQVIAQQADTGKKLGELLVEEGLVSGDKVLFSLREQHWRRLGLW